MDLRTKKWLDYYGGAVLMALFKPWVWLLGQIIRRDQDLHVRRGICFIKMLGGGSLIIAYPALLGLRNRYPAARFSLITFRGTAPFAKSLGIFDRIDTVDDSSFLRLVFSGLRCLWKNFLVDTILDLEVYSRLTAVLSSLTCARLRIGFYLQTIIWRKHLYTHLIFFNRFSQTFLWYDAMARLLDAEPASIEMCRRRVCEHLGLTDLPIGSERRIAIGHGCSDLARERMLDEQQWLAVFERRLDPAKKATVLFIGDEEDRDLPARIIEKLTGRFASTVFENLCGTLPLADSLRALAGCREFWGIDSSLLHYARLLGLQCVSYWGPTDPAALLRPIAELDETLHYGKVPCSPCIHVAEETPCKGNNVCIQSLFNPARNYESVAWMV
jgi:ADP-heptose:LPS heptosyltransferase